MLKKVRLKPLLISILISLGTGIIAGLITRGSVADYASLDKPAFAPPGWLFPLVWGILYILMGISAFLIYESICTNRDRALKLYALQLGVNFLWPIIFFNLKLYTLAFIWILALWILIIAMITSFYRCNKTAAYLQIPYFVWVTFATVLTYAVAVMN
ncbi:MAG: tryptophan-rich sensory protein [Clostridia bacterium]|nr:tryptophan-rich sensory protein [Clostridia bacterium]